MEEKYCELCNELVPENGEADTKAGELLRAVSQIDYQFSEWGLKIDIGSGAKACNSFARFILQEYSSEVGAWLVRCMWGLRDYGAYEKALMLLIEWIVAFIEGHPELREQKNDKDSAEDYRKECERCDDEESDEEKVSIFAEPWAIYESPAQWEVD